MPDRYTILDRAYWRSPVHVLTGLSWAVLGFCAGLLV